MPLSYWIALSVLAALGCGSAAWIIVRTAKPKTRTDVVLVRGNITTETTDVIVNAAKSTLLGGGGVDGAIHAAGGRAILDECRRIRATRYPGGLPVGQAVETSAGRMAASWVIHTVGPYYSPIEDRSAVLRDCYVNSLALAEGLGARSIAFPLISSGVYGWPKADAVKQFLAALKASRTELETIRLVLFDDDTFQTAQLALTGLGR